MAEAANPYQAPRAEVTEAADETQPVKVFSTRGRIGRARYIAYGAVFYIVIWILMGVLAALLGPSAWIALVLGWAAMLTIGFLLTIQRCHDFNTSGWLSLLVLVPLANLVFWFIPGTDGSNDYGPPTPPNSAWVIVGMCIPALGIPVIGILAAIAIPAYNDYTVRAKMTEVILAAAACRQSISEIYMSGRGAPGANKWGCESTVSKYVGTITTSADGKVTVTTAGGLPAGAVTLVPLKAANTPAQAADIARGPVTLSGWRCGSSSDGTTVSPKYLSSSCRGQ